MRDQDSPSLQYEQARNLGSACSVRHRFVQFDVPACTGAAASMQGSFLCASATIGLGAKGGRSMALGFMLA